MTAACLLLSAQAWAGALTVPNTFTAGTAAVAADVNGNFTAVKTAVDDNDARITTNAANITANTAAVTTAATNITALQNAVLIRTITISPVLVGGVPDALQSGTALLNAMASITGATATNPYLLKLEPGVYDLGAGSLTMKQHVSLVGSGIENTTVTSTVDAWVAVPGQATATVGLDSGCELRFITIRNSGGGGDEAMAVNTPLTGRTQVRLSDMRVEAFGSVDGAGISIYGLNTVTIKNIEVAVSSDQSGSGIYAVGVESFSDVKVTVLGGNTNTSNQGVSIDATSVSNVSVTVTGGVGSSGGLGIGTGGRMDRVSVSVVGGTGADDTTGVFGQFEISNSRISATGATVNNSIFPTGAGMNVYNSTLTGLKRGAGTALCSGVAETTTGAFIAARANCP